MLMYLAWYGFGRMFIEGLRTDSLYIGVFRISQVVGFLCFVICTSLLVYFWVREKRRHMDTESYVPVYEKLRGIGLRRRKNADDQKSAEEAQGGIDAIIARAATGQQEKSGEKVPPKEEEDGKAD